MEIEITWKVEELSETDLRGRRLVAVHECYTGVEAEDRVFRMPGIVHQAFIRARRDSFNRAMSRRGHTKKPEIDWSFLETGTKQ